ncbi:MAG: zf-HC2 domain-containing protein [Acidimicrobiia bacterium]
MRCDELAANLTEFLEGELDDDAEAEALEHLASCDRCELVLAQTRSVLDLSGQHGRVRLEPDERAELFDRIRHQARQA